LQSILFITTCETKTGFLFYNTGFMGTSRSNVKLNEMFALDCTIATSNF